MADRMPQRGDTITIASPECWVVAYHDRSGIWVYPTELQALRGAVERSCSIVQRIPLDDGGIDLVAVISGA